MASKKFHVHSFELAKFFLLFACILISFLNTKAQCPANIDFEDGTFNGWTCWIGNVAAVSGQNVITLNPVPGPIAGRHEMLSAVPGNGLDYFGQFPQNCPNGSGHSIKLGNTQGGAQAEGVSYQFTIPAGQNKFSLIYYYAVVFQDPGHLIYQQPKLEIEIKNLTDNTTVGCSSFSFIASSGLPGFFQSRNPIGNVAIWCKDWSATSINLDGNAGKTIRLFFKTADCTFAAHFGYAYVDVNTECSSSFVGATFCPDDTAINVTAPYGYQNYKWFNSTFSQVLGTQQVLHLSPAPATGSTVAVELTPFNGYGCKDTLYAQLLDTLTVVANAGPDKLSCNSAPVQIGVASRPGLVYQWRPTTGLSDAAISNPLASPANPTQYVLKVTHDGGGCQSTDTVMVNTGYINDSLFITGNTSLCGVPGQNIVLEVRPADSIQWVKDGVAIPGANQTTLVITQTGAYSATLFDHSGCSRSTVTRQINFYPKPVAGYTTTITNQCLPANQFEFTNSSTPAGSLQYAWDFGDGNTSAATDVTHTYGLSGTFLVKLVVTNSNGCKDSTSSNVTVYPNPKSGFNINNPAQCLKNNQFIFTDTSRITSGALQYNWDLGDGTQLSTGNVTHQYAIPGIYTVKLVAAAAGGCKDSSSTDVTVNESPKAGFTVDNAAQCFSIQQFSFTDTSLISSGNLLYNWNMGDGTSKNTKDISYRYGQAGDFIVKLVISTPAGCKDSASLPVTVYPTPVADFTVSPVCTNILLPLSNKTVNNTTVSLLYLWDFGDGQVSTLRDPSYSYTTPGSYIIKLTVSTAQCASSPDIKQRPIVIDAPLPGIRYSAKDAVINFPLSLQARTFGSSILWSPGTSLNTPNSYAPVFKGLTDQLYTITIKTPSGCTTVDTQLVKTFKKIEIYVPTGFSPDGNGRNDYLRPVLMGFKKVNYFRVYNRWGQLLFQMNSDLPGWNGTVNGVPQDTQAVIWMIEAEDVDGVIHRKQGSSVIIR